MNFSEFKQRLGADPRNQDPEFLAARDSSPELTREAEQALDLEQKIERAVKLPMPDELMAALSDITRQAPQDHTRNRRRWVPMALAASLIMAAGAITITMKSGQQWASVDDYLADHYRHDGHAMLAQVANVPASEVQEMLAQVGARAAPALADIVGVIKYCPTPDGKGVHMVLNTEQGPVTLIYMPETEVIEGEMLRVDDVEAVLVSLPRGSAALLGVGIQQEPALVALVHDSITRSKSS